MHFNFVMRQKQMCQELASDLQRFLREQERNRRTESQAGTQEQPGTTGNLFHIYFFVHFVHCTFFGAVSNFFYLLFLFLRQEK